MQLGMVGLGRMGANMTRRLLRGGHQVVVSDLSPEAVKQLGDEWTEADETVVYEAELVDDNQLRDDDPDLQAGAR